MKVYSKLIKKIASGYYIFVVIIYACALFFNNRKGVLCGCYLFFLFPFIVIGVVKKAKKPQVLLLFFALYQILSVILLKDIIYYLSFCTSVFYSTLPMVFFIFAYWDKSNDFMNNFVRFMTWNMIINLVLYAFAPWFYVEGLYRTHAIPYLSKAVMQTNFDTNMGITAGSSLIGILFLYYLVRFTENKSQNRNRRYDFILIFVMLFALLLTFRRGAWLAAICNVLLLIQSRICHSGIHLRVKKKNIIRACLGIIILCAVIFFVDNAFWNRIIIRIGQFKYAIGERSSSWYESIKNVDSLFWGNGFGSFSHYLAQYKVPILADSYFLLLIAENGIIGFLIFALLILVSIKDCFKNRSVYFYIVCFILIQSIGSNMLEFQLITPIFWYSLGKCASMRCCDSSYITGRLEEIKSQRDGIVVENIKNQL